MFTTIGLARIPEHQGEAIFWTAVATGTLLIGMFLTYRNLIGFSVAVV